MISPEDLRIGNFVKVSSDEVVIPKGKLCEVVGINSEMTFFCKRGLASLFQLDREKDETSHGIWCDDIRGIPVTLDFLEKNNFKETEHRVDEDGFEWHTYENEDCCVEIQHYPISDGYAALYCGKELCSIAYVHELQNILASIKENIKIIV